MVTETHPSLLIKQPECRWKEFFSFNSLNQRQLENFAPSQGVTLTQIVGESGLQIHTEREQEIKDLLIEVDMEIHLVLNIGKSRKASSSHWTRKSKRNSV